MPYRFQFAIVFILSFIFGYAESDAADAKMQSCLKQVKTLSQKKDIVLENGGMWTYFTKTSTFRAFSTKGLQLDSKVNRIMNTLQYLCETINGVPLNDLAIYLVENMQDKSKKAFRAELIILGKNHGVIDVWMKYHDVSLKNQHRSLDLVEIEKAMQKAYPLLDRYENIRRIINQSSKDSILMLTQSLLEEIDHFLSSDPMMSQAILEDSQVPYWDINESAGGS